MKTNKVIQITFCLSAVMINKLVCTLPHVGSENVETVFSLLPKYWPTFIQGLSCKNCILTKYLYMLEVLCAVSQLFQPWAVFEPDETSPHSVSNRRDFLYETFPERWTGRSGRTAWPPRLPDITPVDFYFWVCKVRVYCP